MKRSLGAAAFALGLGVLSACAPKALRLPHDAGRPVGDPAPAVAEALGHCDQLTAPSGDRSPAHEPGSLHSISAEAGLSGRAGGRRLRGRLIVGIEMPDRIRIEAVAPFGPPVFILAAREDTSVLLLPRDDRVLRGAKPAEVLEALAGVSLSPADLASFMAGCVRGSALPSPARAVGDEWIVLGEPSAPTKVYLRRRHAGWRLAAVERPDLVAAFEHSTTVQPSTVRLQSRDHEDRRAFDLSLELSQVEVNAPIPPEAFTVTVPPDAVPISLEELRQAGPMRDRDQSSASAGRQP